MSGLAAASAAAGAPPGGHLLPHGLAPASEISLASPIARAERSRLHAPGAGATMCFADVTRPWGIRFDFATDLRRGRSLATVGGGVAAADIDGDGLIDLFFTGSVRSGRKPLRGPHGALYINRGAGRFEDITSSSGILDSGWAMGAHFADIDSDGLPDLFVTASGSNRLYVNHGEGAFSREPRARGLEGGRWAVGAAFLDADRDGRVDVYIGHYLKTDYETEQSFPAFQLRTPEDYEPEDNALYLQRSSGWFRDATVESGAAQPNGKTLGAAAFDADADGVADIFVANDRTANALLKGRGDGTFEDVSAASGLDEITGRIGARAGMGIAVGDADGDALPEVVITNFGGEPATFYRNMGKGLFEDGTDASGLAASTDPYVQWGVHLEDLDNDGRADLFIASGHLVPKILTLLASVFRKGGAGPYGAGDRSYRQPMQLFRGGGDGTFVDVSSGSCDLPRTHVSARGTACADFDGDGRLDLAVAAVSGGVRVFRNVTPHAGHAIQILPVPFAPIESTGGGERTAGPPGDSGAMASPARAADGDEPASGPLRPLARTSRATALGTRIVVTSRGLRQSKEFMVVPSYASGSWLPLHFGLGDQTTAESIEIWPAGATRPAAVYKNVQAGALYTISPLELRMLRRFAERDASP